MTVPSRDSEEEVSVTYSFSSDRLFAYAEEMAQDDLKDGEIYSTRLNDDHIGAMWWCWGETRGELKGKDLHSFSEDVACRE